LECENVITDEFPCFKNAWIYENRTMKAAEIVLRRGGRKMREKNREDESN
jgi:hypothetical protein